jgi:hypothetical protein
MAQLQSMRALAARFLTGGEGQDVTGGGRSL